MKIAERRDLDYIEALVASDYARHYFIALGLKKGLETYQTIYMNGENILFHRASGNIQFVYKGGNITAVKELLKTLSFKTLIGAKSTCSALGLKVAKEGAFIAELKKEDYQPVVSTAVLIELEDLEAIQILYQKVFSGYPKVAYMKEKLISKRGIGFKLVKDSIVAVAQSDFNQLIVGVATDPEHLRNGHALNCMHGLIQEMFKTETSVYLQYDSLRAGKLYKALGFKVIDQVMHYER
jgi:hypothetical protein